MVALLLLGVVLGVVLGEDMYVVIGMGYCKCNERAGRPAW
jgi:hypothetical protein